MRRLALLLLMLFGATGCRQMALYHQPVQRNMRPSQASGWTRRPPPATVPTDAVAISPTASPRRDDTSPPPLPVTRQLVERGRERFDVFCAPCHGRVGSGDGMIVQRGFPPPPSFHEPPLREAGPAWFAYVMEHGYGRMSSYADRVDSEDRWAIAVYVKALQLSQDFPADALTAAERAEGVRR